MRDVVLQMQVSFDGYVAADDGSVEWAFPAFDDAYTAWGVESLWRAGVHVMGGSTGRGLASYWPRPDIEERDRPFAAPLNQLPKVVFSRKVDRLDWHNTRVVKGDLATEIGRLKQEDGNHILVHGGAAFAQALADLHLIDRYELVVHPVVLGSGVALFPKRSQPLRLEMLETRPFPSGAALHVFRPAAVVQETNR
jgi:dihydrofolate reductase